VLHLIGEFECKRKTAKILKGTLCPLVVKKNNFMHFAAEHCFGCALALHDYVDEYDSSRWCFTM